MSGSSADDYRVASTAKTPRSNESRFAGWAPVGTRHAYRVGDAGTACGKPLVYLNTFPQIPFTSQGERLCTACVSALQFPTEGRPGLAL